MITSPASPPAVRDAVSLRHDLRPGDVGWVVALHGVVYASEHGFDLTFEAYVAAPLAEFVRGHDGLSRLWIAEQCGRRVGCIAVVAADRQSAQLRWFLVEPAARGGGVGKRLLREAVTFTRESGYRAMFLWTVNALEAAAHLYQSAGFRKVEERPGRLWGADVVEQKYELAIA